jgi:cytochrome b involved in lipid metabolism
MESKAYSSILLIAVFLSAISMPSQAATIAGTKCTKVGTTKTVSKVKYFCVKSGTKLIWNKGTVIKTTPKPSVSATAKPSVSASPASSQSAAQSPSPTKTATPSASSGLTKLTLEEVKKHASSTSCWSIVYENVFDLTKWIPLHPGGAEKIRAICGVDGTSAFERQHTGDGGAASQLSRYFLGKLGESVKL